MFCCSGCIKKKEKNSSNIRNYIVYNIGELPEDLLMAKNPDLRKMDLLMATFEGLVRTDENGNICPGIAESWDISEDKLTYTFKIRNDAKWSDGTSITAEDIVDFFSMILNKEIGSTYAEELNCIFGVPLYIEGKNNFNDVAINALDSLSLEIRLNYPCSYFLNVLSQPEFSLRKDNDLLKNWKENYKEIKYSGPFEIDNITKNGEVIISKNLNYWNRDEVKSNILMLTSLSSNEMALANLETSKIDIMLYPPLSELDRLKSENKMDKFFIQKGAALMFNIDGDSPSKDENFRKAIYYAIDRDKINNEIFYGLNTSAASYVPRKVNNMSFDKGPNIEKAKEYLKNSKYDNEAILLIYLNSGANKKVCEQIVNDLRSELNINIKSKSYNYDEINQIINKKEYDIIFNEYYGEYDDDSAYLKKWCSDSNIYGYKNSKFDQMIGKSNITKDESKRKELLNDAERLLIEEAVVVPLYFENIAVIKRKEVQGLYITKRGNVCFEKLVLNLNKVYVNKDSYIKLICSLF